MVSGCRQRGNERDRVGGQVTLLAVKRLSEASIVAGIDENRTHPGRLNSAPQTVLKTAFLASANVQIHPPKMESQQPGSADVL